MARPGSNMESIAQHREQKFNEEFFGQLYNAAGSGSIQNDFYGNVSWNGADDIFPSLEEAWNIYRTQAQSRMIRANYAQFKQAYDQMAVHREQSTLKSLQTAKLSGASDESLQDLARQNPDFHKKLVKMSATNPELAAQLAQFLPPKPFSQQYAEDPAYYLGLGGATVAGGSMAAQWLGQADPTAQKAAFDSYKAAQSKAMTPVMKEARKARKALDAAKKSKSPARIKAAQYRYDKAAKKVKSTRGRIRMDKAPSRWRKYMGGRTRAAAGLRMGAFMAGPMLIESAVGSATGNKKVGEIAGTSSRAALGVKFTTDALRRKLNKYGAGKIGLFVLKRAPGLAARLGLKAGTAVVGGSLTGGALTIAMAAWTVHDLQMLMKLLDELE